MAFAVAQAPLRPRKPGGGRLQVRRDGIVDQRVHAVLREVGLQRVASLATDHEEVVRVRSGLLLGSERTHPGARDAGVVGHRDLRAAAPGIRRAI